MNRVTLRKLTVSDVDDLLAIISNPDVVRFIPGMIQDRDAVVAWINSLPSTDREFMILKSTAPIHIGNSVAGENITVVDNASASSEIIIGECSLDENGEIGLMLLPEYWRQGYGTATVRQLMKIALGLGLAEVTAQPVSENEACVGLFRSLGFTVSGIGWFMPEEVLTSPEKGMKLSKKMIMFRKKLS